MSCVLCIAPVRDDDKDNVEKYYGSHEKGDDSGLDIHCFEDITIPANTETPVTIRFGIKCELIKLCKDWNRTRKAYWMVPRSSISKTPLRLANSIGLIDSGYRGELMAKVDNVSDIDYHINAGDRLFQLVAYNLEPMSVKVVQELSETKRGEAGFGSTGK